MGLLEFSGCAAPGAKLTVFQVSAQAAVGFEELHGSGFVASVPSSNFSRLLIELSYTNTGDLVKPALAGLRSEVRSAVRSGGDLPGPAMNQLLNVTRLKAHWY